MLLLSAISKFEVRLTAFEILAQAQPLVAPFPNPGHNCIRYVSEVFPLLVFNLSSLAPFDQRLSLSTSILAPRGRTRSVFTTTTCFRFNSFSVSYQPPLMVHTKRISECPTLLPTTTFSNGTSPPASLTEKSSIAPMSKFKPPLRRPSLPRALTLPPGCFLARRLPLTVACISLITLACILLRTRSPSSLPLEHSPQTSLAKMPQWSSLKDVALNSRGKPIVDFETRELPEEWRCNPFKEPGRLIVDLKTAVSLLQRHFLGICILAN